MALGFSTTLRNARADAITAQADLGAGASLLRVYDGTRPATGGTVTNLLAELTFTDPFAGSAVVGVLTANSITGDSSADATGTATWFRVVDSDITFVKDGDCGTSGSDLNFNSVEFAAGAAVDVSSYITTEGNA